MKYSHYAPKANVEWLNMKDSLDDKETLYLLHSKDSDISKDNIINFHGDYAEMAHRLFDCFRSADHSGYKRIAIEPFSEEIFKKEPLAAALENRISKAVG